MVRRISLVFAASLILAGCNQKEEAQVDDPSNPHYKQAQQDLDNNNPKAAVADYEEALAADPKLAGAHYELGLIYGDKLGDPIGSIFHFRRFLELAPDSDKADQVKALIDKQSQAFAASLPNSAAQNGDDYAKLQNDNAALKKQVSDATRTIAQLQTQLGKRHGHLAKMPPPPATTETPAGAPLLTDTGSPSGPATPPAPSPAVSSDASPAPSSNAAPAEPPRAVAVDTNSPDVNAAPTTPAPGETNAAPAASSGPSRTYTVVKGDSIWRIAHKMYPGDTKNGVDKIQEANKEAIGGKPLKIGQVLVIP
jgi:LysM repeat protein